ncbi:helix-turn-helix transcriptional regulator [Clostridium botulinum]|uniref:helix-turn-helix domain-containing protein n=1 Tax=unclassified Clostridium TaxID=2614128 RepID=UPI0013C76AE1|nr:MULTISPECIES: helix-turn-helix transcriptional regulator [unclassified Clostridium]MBY7008955.1 helix-turn-helix transcriptional regulator [Clostridium botulinum]NFH73845.1 helix-turn-helix transcriptional regulator [Clostridium botulinum]NFI02098.1 helix-turn-helix transcriptional regulator [Clostridium botulinum]NFI64299.1 helix-turn-helix transcriptional regulator [Clostridium botulinum]NFJ45092.1 helix-turn-helix transcriptional regulator [Clostridium botulinum]
MNERVRELRKVLKISQDTFSSKINISRSHYALIESGNKNLTDRVIADICREFNTNEDWLRNGIEPMFIEPDTFSLDEYVKQKGATDFELKIIKAFFEMDPEIRKTATEQFKASLSKSSNDNELAATKEEVSNSIDAEVEAYRQELEAESKGEILSASGKRKNA